MARRFGRPQVRSVRRSTDWQFAGGLPSALTSVPSAATRVINSVAITEGTGQPGTIVRIRGCVHLEIAVETAAPVLQMYGVGIGLFDDRAFAVANAAGLPKPLTDTDDEKWMWFHCGFIGSGPPLAFEPDPESEGTGRVLSVDLIVDSKAMRKWDENQTLAWVVENEPIDGTATEIDAVGFGRQLLKLH